MRRGAGWLLGSAGAVIGLGTAGTGGLAAAASGRSAAAAFLAVTLRLRAGATDTASLELGLLTAAALTAGFAAGTLRAVFLAAVLPVAALGIAVSGARGALAVRLRAAGGTALLAAGVGG